MDNIPSLNFGLDAGAAYAGPVARLLSLGEARGHDPDAWPDYQAEFGIGPEDSNTLIRMACDPAFNDADSDMPEVWAPVHAWRALGQLRAQDAVAPLTSLLVATEWDDAANAHLPAVLGMIGPAAIPHLQALLAQPSHEIWTIVAAHEAISYIGRNHPHCRDECVALLVQALQSETYADPGIIGFAVSGLIDLAAVEAIGPIRAAFARGAVDISTCGDMEDVEIALGLRTERVTPEPHYFGRLLQNLSEAPENPWDGPEWSHSEPATPRALVGRNDPCPCGSGKKYKKCCL